MTHAPVLGRPARGIVRASRVPLTIHTPGCETPHDTDEQKEEQTVEGLLRSESKWQGPEGAPYVVHLFLTEALAPPGPVK